MLFVLILSNRTASYGAIMAALPYMQLYIADYLADTMHLSAEEHGAYLLLMFNYWQTGKPIPKNRLAKIARLTNERWADVEPSLREFFCDNGEEWGHLRIEEDLASVREKLTKKSAAGKASVQARRSRKEADVQTKQERNLTGVQTDVEVVFEHDANTKATNKDTDKDLKTDPPLNPPGGIEVSKSLTLWILLCRTGFLSRFGVSGLNFARHCVNRFERSRALTGRYGSWKNSASRVFHLSR